MNIITFKWVININKIKKVIKIIIKKGVNIYNMIQAV